MNLFNPYKYLLLSFIFLGFIPIKTVKSNTLKKGRAEKQGYYKSKYGIMPNNTLFIIAKVAPNELLPNLFSKYGLETNKAYQISSHESGVINPTKIKTGNTYAFLIQPNGKKLRPLKFFYEKNAVDYAVVNFLEQNKEPTVELRSKPIERKQVVSTGIVKGSLYETMLEINANPLLAVNLSEIYKWTINFHKIQENDHFKVIYWEEFVEGEPIGEFDIEAAEFQHKGKTIKAFKYQAKNSKQIEYFDENGKSLKEFFLQAPVAYIRISSPYSKSRLHPVTGRRKAHLGTDYAAPHGTPIHSTAKGVVIEARYSKYNGNYVKIKHDKTYTTQYLHMSKIAKGIKKGKYVEQGQVIGYVGSTGLATGPHVCYRFWKNGKQVNPNAIDIPKSKPLPKAELTIFKNYINHLNKKLNQLKLIES